MVNLRSKDVFGNQTLVDECYSLVEFAAKYSAADLILLLWQIHIHVIARLERKELIGVSSAEVQLPESRTRINAILDAVKESESSNWSSIAEYLQKYLIEALTLEALYRKFDETVRKIDLLKRLQDDVGKGSNQKLMVRVSNLKGDEQNPQACLYRDLQVYYDSINEKEVGLDKALRHDMKVLEEHRNVAALRLIHRDSAAAVTRAFVADDKLSTEQMYQQLLSLVAPEPCKFTAQHVSLVFSSPWIDKHLWTFHSVSGEFKAFKDPTFDFLEYSTIMAGDDLYAFKASEIEDMEVVQLQNAALIHLEGQETRKRVVSTNSPRDVFCLAQHKSQQIYVCGGSARNLGIDRTLRSVLQFSLQTHEWRDFQAMNQARFCASATCAGDSLYVFGGYNRDDGTLGSIETVVLTDARAQWELIVKQEALTPRTLACVASISADKILICGGSYKGRRYKDVIIFDTKKKVAQKRAEIPFGISCAFGFAVNNQTYHEQGSVVLAMVEKGQGQQCMVRIGVNPSTFEEIHQVKSDQS